MDETGRYVHPQQTVSMSGHMPQGYGMHTSDPNSQVQTDPTVDGHRKQDIGDILQQIMNITDQSLDEAQARSGWATFVFFLNVFPKLLCSTCST